MRRLLLFAGWLFGGLAAGLLVTLIVGGAVMLAWFAQGGRVLSVQSGSMAPGLRAGDLVVTEPIGATDLRVGDIVSYHSPTLGGVMVTHRIAAFDVPGQMLITQGDSLETADPPVRYKDMIGRVVWKIPAGGRLTYVINRPLPFIGLMYIIAIGMLYREVRHYERSHHQIVYKLL